nr:immunoglobulin light chain junction region [Mus musculus]NSL97815.1 immunoglobulin light chain junction region [Mus musculus]NSL98125.1 immunoglobulin light chain junction region [Mus musculus]NSL98438.1 immunoglobulin light chain junction region [Mus musculus]NSL99086.1 immunoglobulin light chain junction region [Mus musculus]
CMQHLEYPLTF